MGSREPTKSGTCCDLQSEKGKTTRPESGQWLPGPGRRLRRAERGFWEKPQLGSACAPLPELLGLSTGNGCAFSAGKPLPQEPRPALQTSRRRPPTAKASRAWTPQAPLTAAPDCSMAPASTSSSSYHYPGALQEGGGQCSESWAPL